MEKLDELINENPDEFFISGGASTEEIGRAENMLNIKIEKEYREYLLEYGMVMGFGVEILGFGKNGNFPMVKQTLRFRMLGLENCYLVIRISDEWIYCLNADTGKISSWDTIDKEHIIVAESFNEYVIRELTEAKEDSEKAFDDWE